MLGALLYGLGTGILLSCTFGTVFFSLVQSSVDNGYRSGVKIAFGVFVCDILFVIFALFGTAFLPAVPHFDKWLTGIGVIFLSGLGLSNLIRGQTKLVYPKSRIGNFLYYFTTGFLLNGLNPVNFIAWATLATYVKATLKYDSWQTGIFFSASVVAIFLSEALIAVFAQRLQPVFTEKVIHYFNKATGIVFIGIALKLLVSLF